MAGSLSKQLLGLENMRGKDLFQASRGSKKHIGVLQADYEAAWSNLALANSLQKGASAEEAGDHDEGLFAALVSIFPPPG